MWNDLSALLRVKLNKRHRLARPLTEPFLARRGAMKKLAKEALNRQQPRRAAVAAQPLLHALSAPCQYLSHGLVNGQFCGIEQLGAFTLLQGRNATLAIA